MGLAPQRGSDAALPGVRRAGARRPRQLYRPRLAGVGRAAVKREGAAVFLAGTGPARVTTPEVISLVALGSRLEQQNRW